MLGPNLRRGRLGDSPGEIVVPDRMFAEWTLDEMRGAARRVGLRRIRGAGGLFVATVPAEADTVAP